MPLLDSNPSEQAFADRTAGAGPTPEEALLRRGRRGRIDVAVNQLNGRQRTVFVLRHYEDRALEEIGEIVSLEIGTVKAHLARALSKLREELRDLYGRPALER